MSDKLIPETRKHQSASRNGKPHIIYLASPYTHSTPAVSEQLFHAACLETALLVNAGHIVFSPIVHGHPLVEYGVPGDWLFWERYDRVLLQRCDEVVVLKLDGWRESRGVMAEIKFAKEIEKRVRYVEPNSLAFTSTP